MTRFVLCQIAVLAGLAWSAPALAQTRAVPPQLIGTWTVVEVLDTAGTDVTGSEGTVTMTFEADGRLFVRFYGTEEMPLDDTIKVAYRTEYDQVFVTDEDGKTRSMFFRFEDDLLLLSPDFDTLEIATLRRVLPGANPAPTDQ